jgi:hypothetical protein
MYLYKSEKREEGREREREGGGGETGRGMRRGRNVTTCTCIGQKPSVIRYFYQTKLHEQAMRNSNSWFMLPRLCLPPLVAIFCSCLSPSTPQFRGEWWHCITTSVTGGGLAEWTYAEPESDPTLSSLLLPWSDDLSASMFMFWNQEMAKVDLAIIIIMVQPFRDKTDLL